MKAIGGYFELELREGDHYHKDAVLLNSGRNCLEYILKANSISCIYVPYYTCDVLFQPIRKLDVKVKHYCINSALEIEDKVELENGEYLLYTNYFGLKDDYIRELFCKYNNRLIIDNAQAFFSNPIEGVNTFYSARKFFGVADGAYLYASKLLDEDIKRTTSVDRMSHLVIRVDQGAEEGFLRFQESERSLDEQPIQGMSLLTEKMLCSIEYESVLKVRDSNYRYLSECFKDRNELKLGITKAPMCYPLLVHNGARIKEVLIENNIFIPTFWPFLKDLDKSSYEYHLYENLVCIPVDQRYSISNLDIIYTTIKGV